MGTSGLVQVIQAHRETQAMQNTMNDLNYVMESMSRHIRFGKDYDCKHNSGGCDHIYTNFEGETDIEYRLNAGVIERKIEGSSFEQITSPDNIEIENLTFYFGGVSRFDDAHPRVTIVIQGIVQTGGGDESELVLQTTVNQRFNE